MIKLVERYQGVAYRYLVGALRDEDAAEEVFQVFALRLLQGKFRGVDATKGRFRDYLRTALSRMVSEYYRLKQRKREFSLEVDVEQMLPYEPSIEDETFIRNWRKELLRKARSRLHQIEQDEGKPHYSVIRERANNPDASSDALASRLSEILGRDISPANARKMVQRAREELVSLVIDEVGRSIESEDKADIENELIALGLHSFCHR